MTSKVASCCPFIYCLCLPSIWIHQLFKSSRHQRHYCLFIKILVLKNMIPKTTCLDDVKKSLSQLSFCCVFVSPSIWMDHPLSELSRHMMSLCHSSVYLYISAYLNAFSNATLSFSRDFWALTERVRVRFNV